MWGWRKKEKEKEKNVAVVVDYLGIVLADEVVLNRKIIDFDLLRDECIKYGKLIFPFLFIPQGYSLPAHIHDKGFYPIECPPKNGNEGKEKDRVDTIMTEVGTKFLEHADIDVLMIVARDGDFVRLGNTAKFFKKKLVIMAVEKTSYLLKNLADTFALVPLKNR